jgi:hypothetical protein
LLDCELSLSDRSRARLGDIECSETRDAPCGSAGVVEKVAISVFSSVGEGSDVEVEGRGAPGESAFGLEESEELDELPVHFK